MKHAVIIDDDDEHRQSEAIRVAVGLTLCDDTVDLYVINTLLAQDEGIKKNLDMLNMTGGSIYSNESKNSFKTISTHEFSEKILEYDSVFAY
ncbi:MAG: hypothetical protein ACE5FU_08375 [Nitrospinota bacterium]